MNELVLSLFPGIGLLDMAFEQEGFCVVRGPDVLWGGDIRRFHPPSGRFAGVIGGPPCQMFSRLAHMVRQNGYEPKFGNLIPEFERCVVEAAPGWFIMENVPDAPVPEVEGYGITSFCLNNRQLGEKQNRVRRWTWGNKGAVRFLMVETQVFERLEFETAACGGSHGPGGIAREEDARVRKRQAIKLGGSGKVKRSRETLPFNAKSRSAFDELKRKQGLSADFDLPGFTVAAKCQAVGNGVPMAMGRAIAKAARKAIDMSCESEPTYG